MRQRLVRVLIAIAAVLTCRSGFAQDSPFGTVDNSFLVEEAFNQERGVVQNIFVFTRDKSGDWSGNFTQEWPVPALRHQLSYTIPFDGGAGTQLHFGGVLLNYRYQVLEEGPGRPAFAPRVSLILPTGIQDDDTDHTGIQVNLPFSKREGRFYLHANAGFTWLHDAEIDSGQHASLTSPALAGSVIWATRPLFHLLLEAVVEFDDNGVSHDTKVAISPGFRWGWNLRDDKQIVIGLAVPATFADSGNSSAILTYFSYELPFTKNR